MPKYNKRKPQKLSIKEQKDKFKKQGIKFTSNNPTNELKMIKYVGYYKLKEFAYPFSNWNVYTRQLKHYEYLIKKLKNTFQLQYKHLTFHKLQTRYKEDKKLRVNILSLIETIEVSLNSLLSEVLSKACKDASF